MSEPRPIPVAVQGRCLPLEKHLVVSATESGPVRLSIVGGESIWIDAKPEDVAEIARQLGLPSWINAADAEPDQLYIVDMEDAPLRLVYHHLSEMALCYFDGDAWSRDGDDFELRPDARVFGPIPLDEEAPQPGSRS